VQSKLDLLGGLTVMTAVSSVQAEHRLNLTRQIGKWLQESIAGFLATSDPLTVTCAFIHVAICRSVFKAELHVNIWYFGMLENEYFIG